MDNEERQALYDAAYKRTDHPTWARIFANYLLMHVEPSRIKNALAHCDAVEADLRSNYPATRQYLDELDAERARFVDPNRPGE